MIYITEAGIKWYKIERHPISSHEDKAIERWCDNTIGKRFDSWRSPMVYEWWFRNIEDYVLFKLTWG